MLISLKNYKCCLLHQARFPREQPPKGIRLLESLVACVNRWEGNVENSTSLRRDLRLSTDSQTRHIFHLLHVRRLPCTRQTQYGSFHFAQCLTRDGAFNENKKIRESNHSRLTLPKIGLAPASQYLDSGEASFNSYTPYIILNKRAFCILSRANFLNDTWKLSSIL